MYLKKFTTERVNQDLQDTLEANALPYSTIAHWCAEFKRERIYSKDDPRLPKKTKISTDDEHSISDERLKIKKYPRTKECLPPRMLTKAQKQIRLNISRASLELLLDPNTLLAQSTTMDET
ncbi:hypothetical protein EVAR_30603_1 [Eumeta japonica]|uniref:Mos1 transposase HTH domain-containing protein n=1 Tax=Eumeta variegata TaxID=151549 RepID=A0A4C1WBJ6_EUMVA|nr:hypothetical protein EVAR_30603_1 [Eumeta japonica]